MDHPAASRFFKTNNFTSRKSPDMHSTKDVYPDDKMRNDDVEMYENSQDISQDEPIIDKVAERRYGFT